MDWLIGGSVDTAFVLIASAALVYAAVIVSVRVNGLRTFAKMSGYDFAATVAIGSVIATVVLSDRSVFEGALAVGAIVGSQRLITVLRQHTRAERLVDNPPVLVVARGRVVEDGLAESGMSMRDLRATLRTAGLGSVEEATAVVFEPTGERSVITTPVGSIDPAMFADVRGRESLRLDD